MRDRCRLAIAVILLASASAFAAEEAVVLTPKPGPDPRINGARVFGVRPGSPFLFTVAATGERPIRFAAEGLPGGLRLDPATGRSEVGGHSWRTAGDLGLTFEGIGTALFEDGFDVYADNDLHRFGGPGAWNDPDNCCSATSPTGRARPRPRPSRRTSSTRTSRSGRSSPRPSSSAAT